MSKSLLTDFSTRRSQTQTATSTPHFEIVLSNHESLPAITIKKAGKTCHSFFGIPTELVLLMRGTQDPAWLGHENLLAYLNEYGNTHQLAFETPTGQTPLKWRPSRLCQTATELDVHGDRIEVQARCTFNGMVQEHAHAFQTLVANIETQTLSPLQDISGWEVFHLVQQAIEEEQWVINTGIHRRPNPSLWQGYRGRPTNTSASPGTEPTSLSITIESFHKLQLNLTKNNGVLRQLILKIDGQDSPLP